MGTSFNITIDSGQSSEEILTNGSNVSYLEITNSDQTYYQNGKIVTFNTQTNHIVGETVMVWIDDVLQFNGYISRKQQQIDAGTAYNTYQLVGKTYDLWRYATDDNALYEGTTAFIASSIIGTYCTGIDTSSIIVTGGVELTDEFDLTNMTVGDALVKLTDIDNYRFYVNEENEFKYYKAESGTYQFNITEDDIIGMTPIEEADEDLVNDVLVVGGTGYSQKTILPYHDATTVIPSGVYIAQLFNAEEVSLSAVKFYLDRSTDPNQPGTLNFEIWENTEKTLFTDDFDNWGYLTNTTSSNVVLEYSDLKLERKGTSLHAHTQTYGTQTLSCGWGNYFAQIFKPSVNCVCYKIGMQHHNANPSYNPYTYELRTTSGGDPSDTVLASGNVSVTFSNNFWGYITLYDEVQLASGTKYAIVVYNSTGDCPSVAYDKWTNGVDDATHRYRTTDCEAMYATSKTGPWNTFSADHGGSFDEIDLTFKVYVVSSGGYNISGSVESEIYTETCKYMKATLTDTFSSNYILLSGSNDNGTSWITLTDGEWSEFSSESSTGCILKYILSSNGDFSPKIGGATLSISDNSGGFDEEILNDPFNDVTTYMSGDTAISSCSYDGKLQIEGTGARHTSGYPSYTDTEGAGYPEYIASNNDFTATAWTDNVNYINDTRMYEPYYAHANGWVDGYGTTIYMYYDYPVTTDGFTVLQGKGGYTVEAWISTSAGVSWQKVYHEENEALNVQPYSRSFKNGYTYSGVKGFRLEITNNTGAPMYDINNYGVFLHSLPDYKSSGIIESKLYTVGTNVNMSYLLVEPTTETVPDNITYYGTCDNGTTWDKLTPNESTTMTTPGKEVKLKIVMEPSGTVSGFGKSGLTHKPVTPTIDSCKLTAWLVQGGGFPKSGTKIEWSDDISFSDTDVPYPPAETNWKTYTSPKLSGLTVDDKYWCVLYTKGDITTSTIFSDDFSTDTWTQTEYTSYDAANDRYRLGADGPSQNGNIEKWDIATGGDYTTLWVTVSTYPYVNPAHMYIYISGNGYDFSVGSYVGHILESDPPEGTYTFKIPDERNPGNGNIGIKIRGMYKGMYATNCKVEGATSFWGFGYDDVTDYDGKITFSNNEGTDWYSHATSSSTVPDGNMSMQLGWKQGSISAKASNQTSIDLYGRHFKKISDENINTLETAQTRADQEVLNMDSIPRKGTITIEGRTDMSTEYMFSSNLTNFGISSLWDIRSYTQKIDKNGFTTTINYGEQPFDMAAKVSKLEKQLETGD